MLEQAAGKVGRRKAVGLRHFADVIDRYEPAASAHRLHRNRRLAGNMPGQMLGENSGLDVGGAAGGKVDDDIDRLALIERRFFRRPSL